MLLNHSFHVHSPTNCSPQLVVVSLTPWNGDARDVKPTLELLDEMLTDVDSPIHGKVKLHPHVGERGAGRSGFNLNPTMTSGMLQGRVYSYLNTENVIMLDEK